MNFYNYYDDPKDLVGHKDRTKILPDLAYKQAQSGDRSIEVLAGIASSPQCSYYYAKMIIKGPWPPGEVVISTSPLYSLWYANYVIQGPWPPGEVVISTDPLWRHRYNRFLKQVNAGYQI